MAKYIDADELKRSYAPLEGRLDVRTLDGAKNIFDAFVDLMPAADVAEVRHGRWVEHLINNIYCEGGVAIRLTCPVCGECFTVTKEARPRERFCRWCGAKMDEVTE